MMIKLFVSVSMLLQVIASNDIRFDVDLVTLQCFLIETVLDLLRPIITEYEDSQVSYYLYTRENAEDENEFNLKFNDLESLQNSKFDGNKTTIFILHGFTHNGKKEWIMNIKTKILSIVDANVISVDMEKPLSAVSYNYAVCNVYKIAKLNAKLIKWMTENSPLAPSRVHLIGHSLGAHIAGLTGQNFQQISSLGKIGRITGMDPAGPLFQFIDANKRLSKTQATFVDVMHTNGCEIDGVCFGLRKKMGHVDFYPNGGINQPGCLTSTGPKCSHERVFKLFEESIVPEPPKNLTFKSWPCSSWIDFTLGNCLKCDPQCLSMGYHVNTSLDNYKFYLSTEDEYPYAKGDVQK